jgi:hypothetical protein
VRKAVASAAFTNLKFGQNGASSAASGQLSPSHFQFVGDMGDTVDVPERFLGQLLLIVGTDGSAQCHAAGHVFNPHSAAKQRGSPLERFAHALVQ